MKRSLTALAITSALVPFSGGALAAGGSGGKGEGDLHLVAMQPVTVPIIDADRLSGSLRFRIVLDAGSAAAAAEATADLPRLRSATVAAALEFARLNASGLRAVDAERLDQDLTRALKAEQPDLARVLIVEVGANRT